MAPGSGEGGGVSKPKLKSKRERAAAEVGRLLEEDLVFRANFVKALPGPVGSILNAVLKLADEKRKASAAPIPPSTLPIADPK